MSRFWRWRTRPEDRIDGTVGYVLALNDTVSISAELSGLYSFETWFDNATLRPRDLFSLQFDLTSRVADGLYFEPTVSFGLDDPGHSFAIGINVPYAPQSRTRLHFTME